MKELYPIIQTEALLLGLAKSIYYFKKPIFISHSNHSKPTLLTLVESESVYRFLHVHSLYFQEEMNLPTLLQMFLFLSAIISRLLKK